MNTFKCHYCGKSVKRPDAPSMQHVKVHYCDLTCKSNFQKLAKPVTKEWLIEHYIDKRMDCVEIGKLVKRDPKSVWNWMKDFGIPTRPRGSNEAVLIKKGNKLRLGAKLTTEQREFLRQARLKDGHVPYLKNGVHHLKGKHGAETPNWKGGCTPERQAVYSSQEWKETVKIVWARDDAKCQRCGLDHRIINREEIRFALHHIISFSNVDFRYEPSNVVLLCRPCHLWVHSKENKKKEFLKTKYIKKISKAEKHELTLF